jgi:putative flippase GtrA
VARALLFLGLVKNPREVLAAGMGGMVGTGLDVVCLLLLVKRTAVSVPVAAATAAIVGAVACFVWNKYVAFRDRSPVTVAQVARFGGVAVATALLMALAMKLIAVDLRVPVLAAKLICAALIFLVWTYPAQRFFVFTRRFASPSPASSIA